MPKAGADVLWERLEGAGYDVLMRLPIVLFTLFFFYREVFALREPIAARPYFGDEWHFFITVAARISTMMFLVLLAALHLLRRRPVRKYTTWRPKITALTGLLIIYALMLVPRAAPDARWDALSAILLLAGNTLCILAVLDLARSLSIMPEARKLVTTGLYARIRHPLYLAEDIALLGIALQFRSWPAAVVLAVHFYFQIRRMDWEEGILTAAFPEYAEYQHRSSRLVPGLY
jgi:protein-S-isoprenylcysteine O-methyltransferase Ste14